MPILRFDHLLAGSALALTLALTTHADSAFARTTEAETSNAVPAPASADLPPQTVREISPAAADGDVTSSIPTDQASRATALSVADAAIGDQLRDLLASGKLDRVFGGRSERTTIEEFYQSRSFAPIWITDGAGNDRAKATEAYLAGVAAHGLEPADYPLPEFKSGLEPAALAEAELRFTEAVLSFARHAQTGRVHFSRIASDIEYKLERPEAGDVLAKMTGADSAADALESFHPPHPGYRALKAKLAEARARKDEAVKVVRIPDGPLLRYRKDNTDREILMQDPRVPLLRERLGMTGKPNDTSYDKPLVDAVLDFQKKNGLNADGMVGPATLNALNGGPRREREVDIIIANMERWRWIPRDLGRIHVVLNIPDYSLRVMREGEPVWQTKVVVGKTSQATPLISAEMKFITVNPTWNVPPSIIQHEYIPAAQQDPTVLERMGIKVAQEPDGTVRMWQPPGDRNALGRIRFNFPNRFLVYQHDTPDKHLFAHDRRAYSHGCMRVQDPLKYGEVLLSLVMPNEKYTQERLRSMYGPSEININFPTAIPVHIVYQTAFVDDHGKLVVRDDVYGRDARVLAVLNGPDRRVADIPVARTIVNFAAPVRMAPGTFGGQGGFFSSGPSFFDRLFGSPQSATRPPERVGRANNRHTVR